MDEQVNTDEMQINYEFITPANNVGLIERQRIADFLYEHLDEFGDDKQHILKAVDYALDFRTKPGGFILKALDHDKIIGAVVINKTGMGGYIPENILVYIATHGDYRGKGIGKELMNKSIEKAEGSIALHVEPHNPAKHLYEKVGFTNKYLEMRYHKDD